MPLRFLLRASLLFVAACVLVVGPPPPLLDRVPFSSEFIMQHLPGIHSPSASTLWPAASGTSRSPCPVAIPSTSRLKSASPRSAASPCRSSRRCSLPVPGSPAPPPPCRDRHCHPSC